MNTEEHLWIILKLKVEQQNPFIKENMKGTICYSTDLCKTDLSPEASNLSSETKKKDQNLTDGGCADFYCSWFFNTDL